MQKDLPRVLCHFSCGAASAVSTKLAIQKYGKERVTIINIHIKEEHPDNKRFLKDCEEWFGMPITTVQNEKYGGSIYEVFKQGYLKGIYGAPCTTQLKRKVRESFQRDDDIHVFGFTVEEEQRAIDFNDRNEALATEWNLIEQGITKPDCLGILQGAGIDIPVMYTLGYKNNNCFSGDTKFMTKQGVFSLKEKVGERVEVVTRNGWDAASIKYFGKQQIVELTLTNGKRTKVVNTTGNHRWLVPRYKHKSQGLMELTTTELPVGKSIPISYDIPDIDYNRIGVQHGFVFGDGSLCESKSNNGRFTTRAYFHECKSEVLDFFDKEPTNAGNINGLSGAYKELPALSMPNDYLLGFLIGLVASDGCVSKSGVTISNKSRKVIDSVVLIAKKLGLVAWAGVDNIRDTNFKKDADISHLIIPRKCFKKDWLIRSFHKERLGSKFTEPKSWKVVSVVATERVEDVYCAVVDGRLKEFTLDDNILTRNCVGCVKGGMGYWNQIRKDFPDVFARMSMTERDIGHAILKDKDGAVWLDELDPKRGRMTEEEDIECSLVCTGTLNSF